MTRTVGILLLVAAAGICLLGSALLGSGAASGQTSTGGALLGFMILFIIVAPIAGGGVFVVLRGRREEEEQAEADRQRKVLDMVQARGQVSISDVIVELQSDLPTVQDMVYKLVGMGVFSGYINWDEGTLYSAQAADLHAITNCKNCGGEVNFAGRGVQQCPFCGTEYFLAK